MSKAFDMVEHGHLFDLLLQHKLPYTSLTFVDLVVFSTMPSNPMEGHPFYFLYGGKWCLAR